MHACMHACTIACILIQACPEVGIPAIGPGGGSATTSPTRESLGGYPFRKRRSSIPEKH